MITLIGKETLELDNKKNLIFRITSSLIMIPIFITGIFLFKKMLYILILLIGCGMIYEWCRMTRFSKIYFVIGLIIVIIPIVSLIIVAYHANKFLLFTYCIIIVSTDTFAMFGGKKIGGIKLAPIISPNKTWSGLITGNIASTIIVLILSYIPNYSIQIEYLENKFYLVIWTLTLSIIAQLSDLFVSYFKRKFNVKDTGYIIPGHGGILDRFDSIILTAPVIMLLVI